MALEKEEIDILPNIIAICGNNKEYFDITRIFNFFFINDLKIVVKNAINFEKIFGINNYIYLFNKQELFYIIRYFSFLKML